MVEKDEIKTTEELRVMIEECSMNYWEELANERWIKVNDIIKDIDKRISEIEKALSKKGLSGYELNIIELDQLKLRLIEKLDNE